MRSSREQRAGRKLGGCLVAVFAAVALFGVVAALRQPIGRLAAGIALRYIVRSLSGRIRYERLSGDPFRAPRLEGVVVVFGTDSVKAEEFAFSYDLLGVLRGMAPLSEVEIRNPVVFLTTRKAGSREQRVEGTGRRLAFPRLNLRRFRLAGGALFLDGEQRAESLALSLSVRSVSGRLSAQLTEARGRLVREKLWLKSLEAGLTLTPDSLVLERFLASTWSSSARGSLRLALDGADVSAVLDSASIDLSEFTRVPGKLVVRGLACTRGGTGSGEASCVAEGLALDDIRLPRIRAKLALREPKLEVVASGADPDLGEFELHGILDLREARYAADLNVRDIGIRRFDPCLPDVRVQACLRVAGRGLDSASVSGGISARELGVDTLVARGSYDRDRVVLERLEMRGNAGRLWAEGVLELHAADRKSLSVSGFSAIADSFDLGLAARFLGMPLAGRLKGLLSGSGTVDSFDLKGGLRASKLRVFDLYLERALAEVDMSVGRGLHGRMVLGAEELAGAGLEADAVQLVLLDSDLDLRVDRPEDMLVAGGTMRLERNSVECEMHRLEFATREETLATSRPFEFSWGPDSVKVQGLGLQVADGEVSLDLTVIERGTSVRAVGRSLNLRKAQKLFRLPVELWGTCDFEIAGQDSFTLRAEVEDLEMPAIGLRMKDVSLDLVADRNQARIRRLWFVHAGDTSSASGSLTYDLSRGFAPGRVELDADIADPGTWVLFFLRPTLDVSAGRLFGRVRWEGPLSEPNLRGRLRVVSGMLSVPALNLALEQVNAEFTASKDQIVLEKFSGVSGTGMVTASGFVDLGERWLVDSLRYRIKPNGAIISPIPEMYAVVAGDLTITWHAGQPLAVEGSIDVEEALLAFGFGQSAGTGSGADSLVYDLHIRAERGVWLRNPMADIELGVDLTVRKTMSGQSYVGTLNSRQGSIYYLDHTLRVSRGIIGFENIEKIDPRLDIEAELPVRARVRTTGTAPDRIILNLTGSLEKPEFRFRAEPASWDESQVIAYLGLNVTAEELASMEDRQAATQYLSERLLSYLQTQATKRVRRFIGLDELRLESAFAGGEGYKVTVGKYVGRNLYVTYTQNFTGVMQPAFSVEYYLNNRNELVGKKSENGRYSVRYRYKLRY